MPIGQRAAVRGTVAYAVVAVALLLFPYDFSRPFHVEENGARRLPEGGLEFRGSGVVRSSRAAEALLETLVAADAFSVEVWAASHAADQRGPARILSLSHDARERNLMLGQQGDALALRLRTPETTENGTPQRLVPGVFESGALRHITVTYDGAVERVYVDGHGVGERRLGGGLRSWDLSYPLLLGNETTGTRPWRGHLRRVAVYARTLGEREIGRRYAAGPERAEPPPGRGLAALYPFERGGEGVRIRDTSGRQPALDLEIPPRLLVGERVWLAWRDRADRFDRVLNFVVFLPFGALLDRSLAGRIPGPLRRSGVVLAIGALFPLGVETLQYLQEARSSSLPDALLNGAGSAGGLFLARLAERRHARPSAA